ncbi:cyclopentanone monooxygenase [Exophiala viscosa]|uniref:cyclopentanone monooxygenase n=1 Tax=Exophiala viscosa TaxID=2486360 RepID=UPI00219A14D9|nr:cyclopentanone monooxygenase [Exophiala viscosa]
MGSISEVSDWRTPAQMELEALVVGGGFSGVYTLYKLREAGINAKLFEASKELGGVWNYNRYPGARVDSEVPFYQYNIDKLWKTFNWSERFPGHEELRKYFHHVATVLGLYDHIAFEQDVCGCDFDVETKRWIVKTGTGKTVMCKYLIVAAGSSYKKHFPTFPGLGDYKGVLLHAADFPEEGFDFSGKEAAIVGQGATGLQITQEVSKKASNLTVFIRTPNMAFPMYQRKLTPEELNAGRALYPHIFKIARESKSGLPYWTDGKSAKDTPTKEREERWEELWTRGGFNFSIGGYRDFIFDQEANDLMYDFWKKKVRARISDPKKRDIMAPEVPPHPIGTKRPSLEQDYYECIDQANVHVVSLNETGIEKFDEEGMVTTDGKHRKFDVVVLATGYDSITGSFTGMGLRDLDGHDMKERWKDGVRTHLGMTCPGFPNMFMIYSPQAPTALANGTTIIEAQGDWVTSTIVKMKKEGVETIEAQPDAAEKWASDIQEMNGKTLFPLTNSWYRGANIPGKKREQLNYLAGLDVYEKACKEAQKEWTGFKTVLAI